MKTALATILTLAAGLALCDGIPPTPEPAAIPEAEPPAISEASEILEDGTDEIDLEEDDSALAARKPQIKGEVADGDTMALVDIECDDATLADILRQFRKTTGANIITGDSTNLHQRVSVSLRRVPWLQGLQSILNSRGFRLDERENIFRVVEDLQTIPISTRTFQLNHASAKDLCALFNQSYGQKDANGKIVKPIATSFEGANVVVVTAQEKVISDCEAIIKAVDKAVAQIYIEARFLEIESDAMHKLGVQWNQLESWGASVTDIRGGADFSRNPNAKTKITGESETTRADVPGHSRYFGGTLSVDDFRLAMSAFESLGGTQVFKNPKVIVSNGNEAKIEETIKYPNLTITSQRNNTSGTTYTDYTAKLEQIQGDKEKGLFAMSCFFSWGIELTVKPRISPDGIISVEIVPAISDLATDMGDAGFYSVNSGGNNVADAATAAYGKYPIIRMKSITTNFSMKDGSTAVIGGLTRTEEEEEDTGIPALRSIPWAGPRLFGWKKRVKKQKEIIICVTLGIANPEDLPKDMGLPTNAVYGREYIEGTRKEPGFRGGSLNSLKLDLRPLDEQNEGLRRGEVRISPSRPNDSLVDRLDEESGRPAPQP